MAVSSREQASRHRLERLAESCGCRREIGVPLPGRVLRRHLPQPVPPCRCRSWHNQSSRGASAAAAGQACLYWEALLLLPLEGDEDDTLPRLELSRPLLAPRGEADSERIPAHLVDPERLFLVPDDVDLGRFGGRVDLDRGLLLLLLIEHDGELVAVEDQPLGLEPRLGLLDLPRPAELLEPFRLIVGSYRCGDLV